MCSSPPAAVEEYDGPSRERDLLPDQHDSDGSVDPDSSNADSNDSTSSAADFEMQDAEYPTDGNDETDEFLTVHTSLPADLSTPQGRLMACATVVAVVAFVQHKQVGNTYRNY